MLCTRPKFQDQDRDQDRGVQDQDRDQDHVVQDQDRDQDHVVQDQDRDQDRVVQDQDRDQDRIIQDQDLSLKTINAILSCSVTYSHNSDQMLIIFIVIVFVPKSARSHEEHTRLIAKHTISVGAGVAEYKNFASREKFPTKYLICIVYPATDFASRNCINVSLTSH